MSSSPKSTDFCDHLTAIVEIARLGVGGGQRAEDVGLLVLGQLARFEPHFQGAFAVADLVVR